MNKRELSKVFSKLSREEVNLESHKVELTLLNDLKKLYDVVDKLTDENDSWRKPTQEIINKIKNLKEDVRNELSFAENKLDALESFIPKLQSMKDKISQQAKDLGIKPKDIKGFDKIDIRIAYIKGKKSLFKSASKEARKESKQ